MKKLSHVMGDFSRVQFEENTEDTRKKMHAGVYESRMMTEVRFTRSPGIKMKIKKKKKK